MPQATPPMFDIMSILSKRKEVDCELVQGSGDDCKLHEQDIHSRFKVSFIVAEQLGNRVSQ
jgi:hypothetical protein